MHRAGEAASEGLTEALIHLGFETDRLKTGTPPRVDARTIEYSKLEEQRGDPDLRWFSFDPQVTKSSLWNALTHRDCSVQLQVGALILPAGSAASSTLFPATKLMDKFWCILRHQAVQARML